MCIPFAHGVGANGVAMGVDIPKYREAYGDGMRNAARRAQGACNPQGAALRRTKDIQNISDAILSSRQIMRGVKRLPAPYDALLSGL